MKWKPRTGLIPVLFFLLGIGIRANAQYVVRSGLGWRTIETQRFAFHYPVDLETWTRDVALRVEAIDSAVRRVVGYAPTRRTHVVVDDPFETANGMAWPFLDRPIITLWASPPTPRDDIGEYRDWGEMLISHEFTHIAHLTRPTRNSLLGKMLGALPVQIGPIALRAPRWVIEGYATFVEGRVTGSGRPHAAWRAALLREWALEGQLPRYQELDASGAYEGGSYAYLVGSAFLEWLAASHGDSSLVDVWRRLSAKQNRTFAEAFTGVYGDAPATLYGRFSAELSGKAVAVARTMADAGADTGEIVQRLTRSTGDPAMSADGQRAALVLRSATMPSRVVVWRTAPEPDTLKRRRDSLLVAADPEDVPSRPIFPPAKRALATLRSKGGAPYESPRFLRDGRLLLSRPTPRGDGSLVSDLYVWDWRRGGVRRVTHDESLHDADPLPDGRRAVATQCRGGWCGLVLVALDDGAVTPILSGTREHSFYRPRASASGASALVSVHSSGRWRLATVDLQSRALSPIDARDSVVRYDAAWLGPDEIVTTAELGGIANLERLNLRTLEARQLSAVTGAAVASEPNPMDGSVWFLSLSSHGYDVRRLTRAQVAAGVAASRAIAGVQSAPAVSPAPTETRSFGENAVSPERRYALAPRSFRWIPRPSLDADAISGGLSLVSRDVVGLSELTANFAYGDHASWRGVTVTGLWLASRPGVRLDGFAAWQTLSETRANNIPRSPFDVRLSGGEAALDGTISFDSWSTRYRLGGSVAQVQPLTSVAEAAGLTTSARAFGFADGAIAWTQRGNLSSITESLSGSFTGGNSFSAGFARGVASAGLSMSGPRAIPLSLSATYGRTNTDAPPFEQFALGGGPSLLLDRSLLSQRMAMPVLPAAISVGSSVFSYRGSLDLAPFSWYFWAGSTAAGTERFSAWHRVIGAEWTMSIPAVPAAGTPAARGRIGVGESLDAPFRRQVRGYLGLVINP